MKVKQKMLEVRPDTHTLVKMMATARGMTIKDYVHKLAEDDKKRVEEER